MADIVINGAEFRDVPSILIPKIDGGNEQFYDMSGDYAWMGLDCELISKFFEETKSLAETDFATWTPSTTAKAIVATRSIHTFAADLENYEYLLRWKFCFDAAWGDEAAKKVRPIRECDAIYQMIIKRPGSLAAVKSGSFAANACVTLNTAPLLVYYNSSAAEAYTFSTSYGVYAAAQAATFSNSSSNTPTVTVKTPPVSARCSSTYFSTTRAGDIDQENSKYHLTGELFRVKKGSIMRKIYGDLIDLYRDDQGTV